MRSPLQTSTARQAPTLPADEPEHLCGRCRTPFGRSALPCPNDRRTDQ